MVAHSRSVVVISCTMGISAGTTLSSTLGRGAGSSGALQHHAGPRAGQGDGAHPPVPGTYPLRSTTAPFRWMSEAGKMPWGSRSCQHTQAGLGRTQPSPGCHSQGPPPWD